MKCLSERSFNSERNKRRESNIVNEFRREIDASFERRSPLTVNQEILKRSMHTEMVKDKQLQWKFKLYA